MMEPYQYSHIGVSPDSLITRISPGLSATSCCAAACLRCVRLDRKLLAASRHEIP